MRIPNYQPPDDSYSDARVTERRNTLLLRLLQTHPEPRPKRERGEAKPTQKPAKRASVRKPAPSA